MGSWNVAYLLSGDADFVPAVSSLRRRGKIVNGAGFSDASSALIRECYDYVNLLDLLREDVASYCIFKKEGLIDNWVNFDVKNEKKQPESVPPITLTVSWGLDSGYQFGPGGRSFKAGPERYRVQLTARGPIDLSERHQIIEDFKTNFAKNVEAMDSPHGEYSISLDPSVLRGIDHRLETVTKVFDNATEIDLPDRQGYELTYKYNTRTKKFQLTRN